MAIGKPTAREDAAGLSYGLAGQIVGENAYVLMVKADKPGVDRPKMQPSSRALNSIKITGKEEIKIESYADVEAMVQKTGGQPGRQRLDRGGAQG